LNYRSTNPLRVSQKIVLITAKAAKNLRKDRKEMIIKFIALRALRILSVLCG